MGLSKLSICSLLFGMVSTMLPVIGYFFYGSAGPDSVVFRSLAKYCILFGFCAAVIGIFALRALKSHSELSGKSLAVIGVFTGFFIAALYIILSLVGLMMFAATLNAPL